MVKSKDGKTEIISKEENYLRKATENTEELIFAGEQNILINKDMLEVLKKRLKEFKN